MPANSRRVRRAAFLAAALACHQPPHPPAVSRVGPALGAMFSVAAWGPDSARLAAAVGMAFDSVALVDSLLSPDWRGSELSLVNHAGGPHRVSPTLQAVLAAGLAVARASHGAYSPGHPDGRGLLLDTVRGGATVTLARGTTLELDPIARGYALDRAARALSGAADSAVLDLGGQYLLVGGASIRAVGVPDPDNDLTLLVLVGVAPGRSLATTARPATPGDLRDPRTGRPATRARSVTVVAATGVAAAAWSRAFFVLGCDSALAGAGAAAVAVVCADDQAGVRWTDDLTGRVQRAPNDSADSARPGHGRSPAAPPDPASGPHSPSSRSAPSRTGRRAARPAS
ncbi:MAG TPA: FAD:protein FMN transferase [Gemmatimonadales bacterium]|nr:FAD:protein FMN transferase [Gemmatimonadales bacterium]